jgi:beta-lactamase regulating signal transducer with metallopeptidase domain
MSITLSAIDCDGLALAVLDWLGDALLFGSLLAGCTWLLIRLSGLLVKFLVPVEMVFSLPVAGAQERRPVAFASPPEDFAGFDTAPLQTAKPPNPAAPAVNTVRSSLRWPTFAALCYLACAAGLIIRRAWRHRVFLSRCRALSIADDHTIRITEKACRRLGVHRIPSVRRGGDIPSSFVTGFFRPILVIAHHHLVRPDELDTVILHEVAHLRRGDMLVRYLQWIAGSILFFWPVVAWVNRRIDLARECACDEWALRQGKLAAGEYARCLLNALQAMHSTRLACRPAGLASNHKSMERRIEMILQFPNRSAKRKRWNLFTWALLLLWCGFALTGSAADQGKWPATEEAVKKRAILAYNLVAAIQAADINRDGTVTYLEKDAYLVALAMREPKAFMEEFPYADRNHSGILDYLEVYGAIRGITLIAYADRRPDAFTARELNMELYHMALETQEWLLGNINGKPAAGDLDNIWSVLKRVQGPGISDHNRKLDHGGPEPVKKGDMKCQVERPRFQELESGIRAIKNQLAATHDAREAARLEAMLGKLEAILDKLEG